ncbi:MAG: DUF1572 domain-containing protein [Chitinophagaceae bacterium]|nr:MAG: DUF1572 domain-containing protein [Chitinophagaceae bacterium]
MTIKNLQLLFERDLKKVKSEIESYTDEQNLWRIDHGISNSAGNLCLHLIGNLNAYIGVGLANTSYIRNRALEFSLKNIPRAELVKALENTIKVVADGFNNLKQDQLDKDFPLVIWDKPTETEYTLLHLLTHLNYHLGQINYHRRLVDKV